MGILEVTWFFCDGCMFCGTRVLLLMNLFLASRSLANLQSEQVIRGLNVHLVDCSWCLLNNGVIILLMKVLTRAKHLIRASKWVLAHLLALQLTL